MNIKITRVILAMTIGLFVILLASGTIGLGTDKPIPASYIMASQTCQMIASAFYAYSVEHAGKYPEGKTSTEILQKLRDGKYLSDPSFFYYPMPGKIKASLNTKALKPENICYDITCCVDSNAPDYLPLVFLTGYKITYEAGGTYTPLPWPPRSWSNWWNGINYPRGFIAVCYKNFRSARMHSGPSDPYPKFIPADFDPKGKTYRQLTPDGELTP